VLLRLRGFSQAFLWSTSFTVWYKLLMFTPCEEGSKGRSHRQPRVVICEQVRVLGCGVCCCDFPENQLATWRPLATCLATWRPAGDLATCWRPAVARHTHLGWLLCWQPTGDRWRPLATWRPGDLATWRPAGDLLAASAGDLATRGSSALTVR
jgi:hypothetical protein